VRFVANRRGEGEVEVSNDSKMPLQIDSDTVLR
jgi:hypothetical protein